MSKLIETVGNLAVIAATKQACCLTIYEGEITLHTGTGPERTCEVCSIDDVDAIRQMIAYLNFEQKQNKTEGLA